MKSVGLVFTGSDIEAVNVFGQAIQHVTNLSGRSIIWTIAVSTTVINKITRVNGIKYVLCSQYIEARYDKTIRCTHVFNGVTNRFDKAIDLLTKSLKIVLHQSTPLLFEGVGNPCDGYGASTLDLLSSLKNKADFLFKPTLLDPSFPSDLFPLVKFPVPATKYLLYHAPFIPNCLTPVEHRTIYTMFETTKIPSTWSKIINNHFGKLFVPSDFCASLFSNCGITIPIEKVPLGVDMEKWAYKERDYNQPFTFVLFANSHWDNPRKNYQLALNAFTKVFKRNKKVKLILKLTCPIDIDVPSNVEVITAKYSHEELLALLHRSHCLLFPSNGEGYGLPPREAMATGIPCLLTNWSSLDEICIPDVNWWVNPTGLQKAVFDMSLFQGCDKDLGEFAKIQQLDLEEQLKAIVKTASPERGLLAHQWVKENATYDIATDILLRELSK